MRLGLARAVDLVSAEVLAGFLNALGAALLMSQVSTLSRRTRRESRASAWHSQACPRSRSLLPLVGLAVALVCCRLSARSRRLGGREPRRLCGGLAALPTPPSKAPLLNADAVAIGLPAACGIAFISRWRLYSAARRGDDNRCEEPYILL